MPVEIVCLSCKNIFKVSPYQKNNKFCNKECKKIYLKSVGTLFKCLNCDNEKRRTRVKQKYCNAKCQMNYEYKNGIRDKKEITKVANEFMRKKFTEKFDTGTYNKWLGKRGYYVISLQGKRKYEHHYIWEKINDVIPKGHVIHHKNHNKLDNDIDNLELMTSKDHLKLHAKERIIDKFGRFT